MLTLSLSKKLPINRHPGLAVMLSLPLLLIASLFCSPSMAQTTTPSILGRVADINNTGISDVTITVVVRNGPAGTTYTETTQTDANGDYSFRLQRGGNNFMVTASKADHEFSPVSRNFTSTREFVPVNQRADFLAYTQSYTISGRVIDPSGNGVSDVRIEVSGPERSGDLTDATGNFLIRLPAGGTYQLVPTKLNFLFAQSRINFPNLNSNRTITINAKPTPVSIFARVTDGCGKGVGGVTLILSGSQSATAQTDASGNYSFSNLPGGGTYTVTPTPDNRPIAPQSLTLSNVVNNDSASFIIRNYATVSGRVTDANGAAIADARMTLNSSPNKIIFTDATGGYSFTDSKCSNFGVNVSKSGYTFNPDYQTAPPTGGSSLNFIGTSVPVLPSVQFDAASYRIGEESDSVQITVSRTGDTSAQTTVNYITTNNTASDRSDYAFASGTLSFSPREVTKIFTVLVTNDAFDEADEIVNLVLSNPDGATIGSQSVATLTITDNDTAATANPIDQPQFFVRQHYTDFLNRLPDNSGLAFWTNQITLCGNDQQCVDFKRTNTSGAYFLSVEFQQTGYFVYRFYKTAFGRMPRLEEFLPDTQAISDGVVVAASDTGWKSKLETNQQAFAANWVRLKKFNFKNRYDSMTPAEYVDSLFANVDITPSKSERDELINGLTSGPETHATVLSKVVEHTLLKELEKNRAFVLMQYFGYLRRNPDDAPDGNMAGYNFWLQKLNEFGGDFHKAEMVKAFITSSEYRNRFGQ